MFTTEEEETDLTMRGDVIRQPSTRGITWAQTPRIQSITASLMMEKKLDHSNKQKPAGLNAMPRPGTSTLSSNPPSHPKKRSYTKKLQYIYHHTTPTHMSPPLALLISASPRPSMTSDTLANFLSRHHSLTVTSRSSGQTSRRRVIISGL
jgi:hypothetical protein